MSSAVEPNQALSSKGIDMGNDQVNMKHVRKWAEKKDPSIVFVALMIVDFAKEYYELSESVHKGKRLEGDVHLPSLRTWLKLYSNPKKIGKVLFNALGISNNDAGKSNKEKRNENSNAENEELKEEAINDFTSGIAKEDRKEFLKNLTKPEIIFFIRVMAPCFTLYKTHPLELLRKARSGDDDALEKLIKLDKSIIFEPKISEIIHQSQALKEQARMSMVKKAFISQPRAMRMKTIKLHLGGLLSLFTMLLKQKITAADIWALYDAISLDMNDDVDEDFKGMSKESFIKDIQDARIMWQNVLFGGKKII